METERREYSLVDVGWRYSRFAFVLFLGLAVGVGCWQGYRHVAGIGRQCREEWTHEVDKARVLLGGFCLQHPQDLRCVDAARILRADFDHKVQECEARDLRGHLGLDDPWFVMSMVHEVGGFSSRAMLTVGLGLLVWLYFLRREHNSVQVARDGYQNSGRLPTTESKKLA